MIRQKYEKLNNETLPKVVNDKEARTDAKGLRYVCSLQGAAIVWAKHLDMVVI